MKEQMEDEIRKWFLSHMRQTGKYPLHCPVKACLANCVIALTLSTWPDYPSAAAGGSAKIFLEPPVVGILGLR